MQFGISTQFFGKQPVTVDLLELFRKAGYRQIELFANRPHLNFHDRSILRSVGRWFGENDLPGPSIHLPFVERDSAGERRWVSALDPEKRARDLAMDEIKRSLELAEWATPAYLVLHLGNPGEEFNPLMFELAYAAIMQIQKACSARILIENIPNGVTMDRVLEFRSVSELPELGICYDIGHAHLPGADKVDLADVNAMHVHDNDGESDQHLWPFEGRIDWPALIESWTLADYTGPFVFETRGDDIRKGVDARSRLQDLWYEAHDSIEEFRLRHKLPVPGEDEK